MNSWTVTTCVVVSCWIMDPGTGAGGGSRIEIEDGTRDNNLYPVPHIGIYYGYLYDSMSLYTAELLVVFLKTKISVIQVYKTEADGFEGKGKVCLGSNISMLLSPTSRSTYVTPVDPKQALLSLDPAKRRNHSQSIIANWQPMKS